LSLPGHFRQWAILVAYAAYILTPLTHGLANAATSCSDGCPRASESGPSLFVPCDSPCRDPAHHHHHSEHDSEHCAVCQAHATGHALTLHSYTSEIPAECGNTSLVRHNSPPVIDYPGPRLIRGPPVTH